MAVYEYKVIPAPRRGQRRGDNKGTAGRFANSMAAAINTLASDGWEYVRAESLPAEEGGMMRKKVEVYQNVLIFRKAVEIDLSDYEEDDDVAVAAPEESLPELEPAPAPEEPVIEAAEEVAEDIAEPREVEVEIVDDADEGSDSDSDDKKDA